MSFLIIAPNILRLIMAVYLLTTGAITLLFNRAFSDQGPAFSAQTLTVLLVTNVLCILNAAPVSCLYFAESSERMRDDFALIGSVASARLYYELLISVYLLACALLIVSYAFVLGSVNASTDPRHRHEDILVLSRDNRLCREVLQADNIPELDLIAAPTKLHCRSGPNLRLTKVFGVNNSFTTTDPMRRKNFRKAAELKLVTQTTSWRAFGDLAKDLVVAELALYRTGNQCPVINLVQSLTLRMSLAAFFDVNVQQLDPLAVQIIATQINKLWLESKDTQYQKPWQDQRVLHVLLETAIPDAAIDDPCENPLNLLLPAYETLWRVVLRCFVEVVYRNRKETVEWRRILSDFLNVPSSTNMNRRLTNLTVKATPLTIAKEALRLYPPTRRIYRHYRSQDNHLRVVAVDVERSHRTNPIWGADADTFDPERWDSISRAEGTEAFLAFGAGAFQCPAKADFAPRMIAVLVAALSAGVKDDWTLKAKAIEDELEAGRPMDTHRESHRSLYLLKK